MPTTTNATVVTVIPSTNDVLQLVDVNEIDQTEAPVLAIAQPVHDLNDH